MEEQFVAVIRAFAAGVEARERYMSGHARRVADYACALAKACGDGAR